MKNKKNRHCSIRNILLPDLTEGTELIQLSNDLKKHFIKVLRLEEGTEFRIVDGKGKIYSGYLQNTESAVVKITKLLKQENPSSQIELCIALTKTEAMEWIIEKATECGVNSIQAIETSRSVVRLDSNDKEKLIEKYQTRWQKISDDALMQSERAFRVEIKQPMRWKEWHKTQNSTQSFVFVSETRFEQDTASSLRLINSKIHENKSNPIRILIGPEGGFTSEERAEIKELGFDELSLGETVYRTETAVVVALSMIQISRSL